jgi:hypothetical protein
MQQASTGTGRFRGLVNLGNTCWMNASLQALFSADWFFHHFYRFGKMPRVRGDARLAMALAGTFSAISFAEQGAVLRPAPFHSAVGSYFPELAPPGQPPPQRSSAEFISQLLDKLAAETGHPAGGTPLDWHDVGFAVKGGDPAPPPSIVRDIFGSIVRRQKLYLECSCPDRTQFTSSLEYTSMLTLQMPKSVNAHVDVLHSRGAGVCEWLQVWYNSEHELRVADVLEVYEKNHDAANRGKKALQVTAEVIHDVNVKKEWPFAAWAVYNADGEWRCKGSVSRMLKMTSVPHEDRGVLLLTGHSEMLVKGSTVGGVPAGPPPAAVAPASALTLRDCFFQLATAGTSRNNVVCPGCQGSSSSQTAKFSIHRPPKVLAVNLQRFERDARHNIVKSEVPVGVPLELNTLYPLVVEGDAADAPFKLSAVVLHSGSMAGGHYTAAVRSGDRWLYCDDSRVTELRGFEEDMRSQRGSFKMVVAVYENQKDKPEVVAAPAPKDVVAPPPPTSPPRAAGPWACAFCTTKHEGANALRPTCMTCETKRPGACVWGTRVAENGAYAAHASERRPSATRHLTRLPSPHSPPMETQTR